MRVYKENYGADIDGNRGMMITEHEIEDSDFDAIHEQVVNYMEDMDEDDELPATIEITLICPCSDEDIQFEIDPKDYL